MRNAVAALLLFSWIVPAGAGADTFRYETDEGTIAYTDDFKRVPARYREAATKIPTRSLWTYPRVTPVPRSATTTAAWPAPKHEAAAPSRAQPAQSRSLSFEVSPGLSVQFDPQEGGPIRVEREYHWVKGAFRPHTVVRQGDRILAIRIEG
jgi:hypothetical protein